MKVISSNIRYLRSVNGITQTQLAEKLNIKRSLIGAIEEGRTEPRASTLTKLSCIFKISIDRLVKDELQGENTEALKINQRLDESGKHIRFHQVVVTDKDLDRELVSLVPISARAGYADGIIDPTYIGDLPKFNLPMNELNRFGTYRVFQIAGDSMIPIIDPNEYLITEYVDNWRSLKNSATYIIITKADGIVFKRATRNSNTLTLVSENKEYEAYEIGISEVVEIWKPVGIITFNINK